MTTETTTAVELVGSGRGGWMSRQRKCDAVLRLLRGEDLEKLSRALGVTATTLSDWGDTFLSVNEASLAIRPTDAGEIESNRLKANLEQMPLGHELLRCTNCYPEKLAPFGPTEGRGDEPDGLREQRQALRRRPVVPDLEYHAGHPLPPPQITKDRSPAATRTIGPDTGCGTSRADPGHSLRQPPFTAKGIAKVWVCLRFAGVHASRPRVLRLMHEGALLAPGRVGYPAAHATTTALSSPTASIGCGAPT